MPYNTGLCDCCSDTGTCLDVTCCGLCHITRLLNALNFMPDKCDCLPVIFPCCFCCNVCKTQDQMELRFAPETGLNNGCCVSVLCTSCVMCQTSRELHMRNMNPGGTCCKSNITPTLPPALTPVQLVQMMQQRQVNMQGNPNAGV
jgi:hypothetical protein